MLRLLTRHVDIIQRMADHGVVTVLFRRRDAVRPTR